MQSNDITTILTRLEVFNASSPSAGSLITNDPPFLVVGMASTSFLAKVVLYFVGSRERSEQIATFEHWVEVRLNTSVTRDIDIKVEQLDMLERPAPVDGDEQIVDVNLEKGTFLLPLRKGYVSPDARVHWEIQDETQDIEPKSEQLPYVGVLRKLLPRFPMTMKGMSNRMLNVLDTENCRVYQMQQEELRPQICLIDFILVLMSYWICLWAEERLLRCVASIKYPLIFMLTDLSSGLVRMPSERHMKRPSRMRTLYSLLQEISMLGLQTKDAS